MPVILAIQEGDWDNCSPDDAKEEEEEEEEEEAASQT
jgi:hypothetical protein